MAAKKKRITRIIEEDITPSKKKTSKKKPVKKKAKKRKVRKRNVSKPKNIALEKALMENTLVLQKVTTNLALKFDSLSKKIEELLNLFETSAKSLAEKEFEIDENKEDVSSLKEDMNKLMDQNKIIAKSLTLLHESQEKKQEAPIRKIPETSLPPKKESAQEKTSEYSQSISQAPRAPGLSEA
jgi:chromosome segregation ATPase